MTEPAPIIDGDPCWLQGIKEMKLDETQVIYCYGDLAESAERIAARNAAIKETWSCPVRRQVQSKKSKKAHRNNDPDVNARRTRTLTIHHNTPEYVEAAKIRAKDRWQDPEYRERHRQGMLKRWARKRAEKESS